MKTVFLVSETCPTFPSSHFRQLRATKYAVEMTHVWKPRSNTVSKLLAQWYTMKVL